MIEDAGRTINTIAALLQPCHVTIIRIVMPGEEDEGAHPHDGVELADGKGFVAVSNITQDFEWQFLEQKNIESN